MQNYNLNELIGLFENKPGFTNLFQDCRALVPLLSCVICPVILFHFAKVFLIFLPHPAWKFLMERAEVVCFVVYFVFVVADSNKVVSTPITIAEKTGNYYLVENGVKAGDKIVSRSKPKAG